MDNEEEDNKAAEVVDNKEEEEVDQEEVVDNKEELDNKMILYQKEMVRDSVNIINVYLILNFILKNGKNGGYAWN